MSTSVGNSTFAPSTTGAGHRAHNFNAGPAALPLSVLERIREEMLDWHGSGMSVMEMSHRSPEFESINAAAEADLRKQLANSRRLRGDFRAGRRQHAVLHGADESGAAGKAGGRAAHRRVDRQGHRRTEKGHSAQYRRVHRSGEVHPRAARRRDHALAPTLPTSTVHEQHHRRHAVDAFPGTGAVPLVADMSSDIASRRIDVAEVRADFRRRAEKPGASRRDRGDRAQGSGRARGQESARPRCNTARTSRRNRSITRRRRLPSTSWAW